MRVWRWVIVRHGERSPLQPLYRTAGVADEAALWRALVIPRLNADGGERRAPGPALDLAQRPFGALTAAGWRGGGAFGASLARSWPPAPPGGDGPVYVTARATHYERTLATLRAALLGLGAACDLRLAEPVAVRGPADEAALNGYDAAPQATAPRAKLENCSTGSGGP